MGGFHTASPPHPASTFPFPAMPESLCPVQHKLLCALLLRRRCNSNAGIKKVRHPSLHKEPQYPKPY